jgi:hypothetical protein
LPIPEENKKRFTSAELQCWTEEARKTLKPKLLHEVLRDMDLGKGNAPGISGAAVADAEIERQPNEEKLPDKAAFRMEKWVVRAKNDLAVPMVLLRPANKIKISHVVIAIAQDGKAGFLKYRAETIAELLKNKTAVCLVDLRGTGETAADGRGRQSGGTSYSSSLLMHGQTAPGVQLRELLTVMNVMPKLGFKSIALWGDSFAPTNDPSMNFAKPLDVSNMPKQAEPMGGLLALLGGTTGGDKVTAVYARGGLASYHSVLESPFCYLPHDAIIPGVLLGNDINSVAAKVRNVRLEAMVDSLNRPVNQESLKRRFGEIDAQAQPSSPAEVAAWLSKK